MNYDYTESQTCELKRVWKDEYLKTLCAFANGDGGMLVVGVDDSGWAQVNGRNAISWEEKFKFDVWYVDNQSFWLDIKILFLTVKKVFVREGISQDGQATMERFAGSPEETGE